MLELEEMDKACEGADRHINCSKKSNPYVVGANYIHGKNKFMFLLIGLNYCTSMRLGGISL